MGKSPGNLARNESNDNQAFPYNEEIRHKVKNRGTYTEPVLIKKLNKILIVAFVSLWAHLMTPSDSSGAAPMEYQVKAAFIYKFINFIEWPAKAWKNAEDTLVIGVLGENPILEALHSLPLNKVQNRQIKIKRIKNLQDLKSTHIVFIDESEKPDLKNILDHLKETWVLTISDTKEFAKMGGMINFFLDNEKIRFEMNPEAAEEAELKISSKILRLATIVKTQRSSEAN